MPAAGYINNFPHRNNIIDDKFLGQSTKVYLMHIIAKYNINIQIAATIYINVLCNNVCQGQRENSRKQFLCCTSLTSLCFSFFPVLPYLLGDPGVLWHSENTVSCVGRAFCLQGDGQRSMRLQRSLQSVNVPLHLKVDRERTFHSFIFSLTPP
jgi:hypothetical protein